MSSGIAKIIKNNKNLKSVIIVSITPLSSVMTIFSWFILTNLRRAMSKKEAARSNREC